MIRLAPSDGSAIVTGAGSGLGRALARELVQAGFVVHGVGRREAALSQTAEAIGPRFRSRNCDIADPEAVERMVKAIGAEGPIALLINNAALYPRRDFLSETAQSFGDTLAVNLGGTMTCTRAVLKDMAERGRGRILNVTSFADLAPLPASSAYAVSKGATRILTRALAADLSDRFPDIVINDWAPGTLDTAMGLPGGIPADHAARWGAELAQRMDPSLTGTVFEMNREILPPRGLKGRIKDMLLLRRSAPRRLD